MTSDNVVPIAIPSCPAPFPSGGGLRAHLVLEAQLGSPLGPGSCFSVFFGQHPLRSLDSRRAGFPWERVARTPPWQAWQLSGFCPEVPCFRSSNNVHLFLYSRPTMHRALATKMKGTEAVSKCPVKCV